MDDVQKIVKVRKTPEGTISDIMTDRGDVFTMQQAVSMAKNGVFENVSVATNKSNTEYLRSNPNGTNEDNLDTLPSF